MAISTEKLGYGIVGCGIWGKVHAECLEETEEAKLVAVSNRSPQRGLELAQKYHVDYYSDYREMLKRPDIDLIDICVPSGQHAEVAIDAARAGKHVLVEKPIDITLERADRMIQACQEAGVKLSVIFQNRFTKGMIRLKRAAEAGDFGQLILGDAINKSFRSQEYYDSGAWRGTWAIDGGGALMNQSVHHVDLLLWIMGDVAEVQASTATLAHTNVEVEDAALAILKFKNGALGTLVATTDCYPGFSSRLEVHGTRGSAIVAGGNVQAWEVVREDEQIDPFAYLRGPRQFSPPPQDEVPSYRHYALRDQIRGVCQAVSEDKPVAVSGEEGRKALELVLAIYQAARTGQTVRLPLS